MKLIGQLISIESDQTVSGKIDCTLNLDPSHIIYKGHFPGFPVTPGVIQMQIVHELLEEYLEKKVSLSGVSSCKFLEVINPKKIPEIRVVIDHSTYKGSIKVKAISLHNDKTLFKLIGTYQYR